MEMENIVQFAPFQSFVSPTFWHKLAEIKLDIDGLSDKPKQIYGYYSNRNAKSCLMEVDYTAFNRPCFVGTTALSGRKHRIFTIGNNLFPNSDIEGEFLPPTYCFKSHGTIYNKNTIEAFKSCNKNALLKEEGLKLLSLFQDENTLDNLSLLVRFFVLSFADIKSHNYYYWFGFPCPLNTTLTLKNRVSKLADCQANFENVQEALKLCPNTGLQNFFVLQACSTERKFYTIKEFINNFTSIDNMPQEGIYFCFSDNSEFVQPSWLMRIYAAFLFYKCPFMVDKIVAFLGLRYDNHMNIGSSLIWHITQREILDLQQMDDIKFVGWELNKNQKPQPRMVSMSDCMDPQVLTENSINFNLKLMKWRLLPDLNLEVIKNTRCLLFGAGTLGCAVARMLLGWGFKYITFVDNGKVGLANPVRQYLYTYEDAIKGNIMKANAAAESLKKINPSTVSAGHVMQIPMPGHTVGDSLKEQTEKDLNKLQELTKEHDVIFLLTDSRESRWLPALLGASNEKIVINSALGFDSYLVQRHGSSRKPNNDGDCGTVIEVDDLKCIAGNQLGCYFCNDVTAPGNSLKDRTLDQQCTVTRPGVSNIAASYAVELLVSLLHHPLKELAPAYYAASNTSKSSPATDKTPEGIMGILPHSIRGMLSNFENILPASEKFTQCIACSEKVLNAFRSQDNEFLFKVFESEKYLEDLTGISEYRDLNNEIIDFNDSDLELSDD